MVKLNTPLHCEIEENYFIDVNDFKDYVNYKIYLDPGAGGISDNLNDSVTRSINEG